MYIKEINIKSFGCISERKYSFKDGFNLIYGPNESGKTTLLAFVIFAFYGTRIKKNSYDLTFKNRYTPWSGDALDGQVDFVYCGLSYSLRRIVSQNLNKITLICLSTGEEINDAHILASPGEYFFGVGADTFYKTAYFSALTGKINSDNTDEILTKLRNMFESGYDEISCKDISGKLTDEISELSSSKRKNPIIPELKAKIATLESEIAKKEKCESERVHYEEESQKTEGAISALNNELDRLYKGRAELEVNTETNGKNRYVIFTGIFALCFAALSFTMAGSNLTYAIVLLILSFAAIITGIVVSNRIKNKELSAHKRKLFTLKLFNDKIEMLQKVIFQLNSELIVARERSALQQESDASELKRILAEHLDKLKKCEVRLEALCLAKKALEEAYKELKTLFAPELSSVAGKFLNSLSCGRYTDVLISDSFEVSVLTKYGYNSSMFLSRGAVEQVYLAVRLAIIELIMNEDGIPVFLDDVFAFYDSSRQMNSIEFLLDYSQNKQLFFSTCKDEEFLYLKDKESINIIYF